MTKEHGPMWDMFEGVNGIGNPKLVAYARRAKNGGWFVRISELNPSPDSDKLYVDDDVFPPHFMQMMLEMHKKPNSWQI
jgi:hypothetical protein